LGTFAWRRRTPVNDNEDQNDNKNSTKIIVERIKFIALERHM